MAQNVSASTLLDIQAKLTEMFAQGVETPSRFPWTDPTVSVKSLFSEHRARIAPVLVGNPNDPIEQLVRVYWPERGAVTLDIDATSEPTLECDLVSGQGPTTSTQTYQHNLWKGKVVEVDDNLFDNIYDFAELAATQQMTAMLAIRKALNTTVINFLNSNKSSVNNDGSLPTGYSFGSSKFTLTSAIDLQNPDEFTNLDAICQNNDMSDYFYLSGRHNFYNARVNSDYHRLNDSERDLVRFDDVPMYFDIRSLDSTLSNKNTFAVSRGAYALWNFRSRTVTPTQIEDLKWEYVIEDPMLMIYDNGRLRPVQYHVRYQKICSGVNSYVMRTTYTHVWEITFVGGLAVAPPSEDNHTGILLFQQA